MNHGEDVIRMLLLLLLLLSLSLRHVNVVCTSVRVIGLPALL